MAVISFVNGDDEEALGYVGESFMRLFGVGMNQLQLRKAVCFPAGTEVWTPGGRQKIESIAEGDEVNSRVDAAAVCRSRRRVIIRQSYRSTPGGTRQPIGSVSTLLTVMKVASCSP